MPVCMEMGEDSLVSYRAQRIATSIYAEVGVRIEWHTYNSCPAGQSDVIKISLAT